jgi:hypothetical protein
VVAEAAVERCSRKATVRPLPLWRVRCGAAAAGVAGRVAWFQVDQFSGEVLPRFTAWRRVSPVAERAWVPRSLLRARFALAWAGAVAWRRGWAWGERAPARADVPGDAGLAAGGAAERGGGDGDLASAGSTITNVPAVVNATPSARLNAREVMMERSLMAYLLTRPAATRRC